MSLHTFGVFGVWIFQVIETQRGGAALFLGDGVPPNDLGMGVTLFLDINLE